jgi:putative peptidoglycan lipid II flippase
MTALHWTDGTVLAWALTASGVAQFCWLMMSCRRAGIGLRLRLPRLTPAVRQTLKVMGPGVLGAGVTQLNLLVSTALASMLPGGSVSYLYYADRLNQLPLGVVGIAVATAILPPLSRQLRGGDEAGAIATQNRGLEMALILTLPAATALAILALPILTVLFERGAFGPTEASATASALIAYAVGLPAFVLVKVLAPGCGGVARDQSAADARADALLRACRRRHRALRRRLVAGGAADDAAGTAQPLPFRREIAR